MMFRPFVFARLKLCGYDPESEDAAFAANTYGYEKMDALRCGGRFERFGGVQRDGVLAAGES